MSINRHTNKENELHIHNENLFLFVFQCVSSQHMCLMHHLSAALTEARRRQGISWCYRGLWPPWGYWTSNHVPLQRQPAFLTTEQSLHPLLLLTVLFCNLGWPRTQDHPSWPPQLLGLPYPGLTRTCSQITIWEKGTSKPLRGLKLKTRFLNNSWLMSKSVTIN